MNCGGLKINDLTINHLMNQHLQIFYQKRLNKYAAETQSKKITKNKKDKER